MAIAKPAKVPRWATTGTRVEPTEVKKDSGWILNEKPPFSFFNWIDGVSGDWLTWIDERFSDGASVNELEIDPGSLVRVKTTFEIDTGSTTLFEAKEIGTRRTILTKRGSQTWVLKDSGDVERGQVFWGTQAVTPGLTFKDASSLSQSDFALLAGGGFIWHAQGGVGLGSELMRLSPASGGLFSIIVPVDITLPGTGTTFATSGANSAFEVADDGTAIALIDNPTGLGFRFQEEIGVLTDPIAGTAAAFGDQVTITQSQNPILQLITTGGANTTDARILAVNTQGSDGDFQFQIRDEPTPRGWTFRTIFDATVLTPVFIGGGQAGTRMVVNDDEIDYDFLAKGSAITNLFLVDASADTVNVGGNLLLSADKRIELGGTDITIEDLSGSLAMTTDGAIVLTYDDNSSGSETLQILQAATPIFTFENNGDMTIEQAGADLYFNPSQTAWIDDAAGSLRLNSASDSIFVIAGTTGSIRFFLDAGAVLRGEFTKDNGAPQFRLENCRLNFEAANFIPTSTSTLGDANYFRTVQGVTATMNYIVTTGWESGAMVIIRNSGTGNVTLTHNAASPPVNTAAIMNDQSPGGGTITLNVGEFVTLMYDAEGVTDFWYVVNVHN